MTHKIAIITTRNIYNYDNDDVIVESITEWEEVSDEDFKLLVAASCAQEFSVIEQPLEPKKFIQQSISDYKKMVEDTNRKEKLRLEKLKKEKEEKQRKKELKTVESKLKLLKQLQEELADEINQ